MFCSNKDLCGEEIKRIKDKVSEDLKAKQKKVDELIHLLENDPELKKRYEELSIGK